MIDERQQLALNALQVELARLLGDQESLKAARLLRSQGYPGIAASRAYYALKSYPDGVDLRRRVRGGGRPAAGP